LLGDRTPDATGRIAAAAVEADDPAAAQLGRWVLVGQNATPQFRIARQQPEAAHAVRLAAAHGLRQQENRRPRRAATEVPESPVDQRQHAGGEVVLVEEFGSLHLVSEEAVQIQHRGATVGGEDRTAGGAMDVQRHGVRGCGVIRWALTWKAEGNLRSFRGACGHWRDQVEEMHRWEMCPRFIRAI
jgi:hypothetical protein